MGSDWVLVVVSQDQSIRLQEVAQDAVAAGGGQAGSWSVLSDTAPSFAGMLRFRGPPGGLAGLREHVRRAGPVDHLALPGDLFGRKRLLVCDMDSTIIGQECIDELAEAAGIRPQIEEITDRAMRGELDFEQALRARVGMLSGLSLDALARTFAQRIHLNPGAATLVATMRTNGARTLLVSGGFTYFTGRVAGLAGFEAHMGNTLLDDGTCLTGEVASPVLGREAKRQALIEAAAAMGAASGDAVAIGDGANDLDMITSAGLGIAYRAKPLVAAAAGALIEHTDLTTALFFQGYHVSEFVRA